MGLAPVPPQLPTYHIGIGEVEPNKDIQVTGGQPCGQMRVRAGQRGGPHGPTPVWRPLTWGCGQVDALHNEQEHVVAAEVREDPSRRAGKRQRHLSATACPPSLPSPQSLRGVSAPRLEF